MSALNNVDFPTLGLPTRRTEGTLKALTPAGSTPDSPERRAALAEMLRRYLANQATDEPVHTWKIHP